MKWTSFGAQVIYGLIAGVILGLIASSMPEGNWLTTALTTVGGDYVTLLKVLIPPLVMTAVITSIANLRQVTNAARLAVKTLVWFAITAFFSVLAGIGVGLIFKPGETSGLQDTSAAPSSVGSWWSFLEGIVPTNLVGLEAHTKVVDGVASTSLSFNVLQLLVVAIALGIAAVKVGEKAEPFINFNRSLLEIIQKVLWWIIRLAPIGTAALIGKAVATYGFGAMGALGKFVLTVYVGLAIVLLVIYPVTLKLHGLNVAQFYRRVWPVTSLGLVTRSSMGVMPVTEQTAEAIGVPKHYASFAVPLGATTKMDGCAAVYPAVAAIFVSQFYGVPLNFTDYVLIAVVSVLGSAATAGTTGATVMLTLTLSTLGLPLEGVGLLLAIEPIVDMGRTAVNVTGQVLVPAIVAKQEKLLDAVQFNAKRTVAEEKVSV
ncbi:dicarboxylate/amino acid:cation symporter [Corynebacterium pseudotuberculosis]|uniref:Cation:dicarboxylase symporter family transporter n=1 Tax=Corynebacterium pseudotuberculosis (strain C231) TaxID=681645 RepID=D9QCF3_CORP2|nr:dicarboxylate/amino acid:cation symporter [Corynebacterium pseudotuberculosis]ADK29573.1 cation:dicarboxylase symporter family transporter [Corynebacterium pseudotuberculosis FRC41]ADL11229.1 cation:dicarboxylase symporter family transporter [Corynebacterium pseudotuberculosis C231]ADL21647.1 dicarboxylate/amino acid:cation symporter [Corynebacterium pseudotuberculosis 1002]ADO27040.1 cation:dicarboxylase symporter family transporter [Corynebacterium pseudotuberculosis I19]AEK93104.1 Na+/H+